MPPEPSNRADEQLRQHAEKRRAQGGDFALHPATRQMLQGEVARHFAAGRAREKAAGGIVAWLARWRLVAYTAACMAVLGAAAWLATENLRRNAPSRLAKADAAAPAVPTTPPAATEAAQSPAVTSTMVAAKDADAKLVYSASALDADQSKAEELRRSVDMRRSEPPPTRSLARKTGPPTDAAETDGSRLEKSRAALASRSAPAPAAAPLTTESAPAPVTPPASAAGSGAERLAAPSPAATRFYRLRTEDAPTVTATTLGMAFAEQSTPRPLKFERADEVDSLHLAKAPGEKTAALGNFTFEQLGNVVRVTDADGSVYEGGFTVNEPLPANNLITGGRAGLAAPGAATVTAPARSNDVPFRVSGTNRTLRQLIVLNGRLTTPPPAVAPQRGLKEKMASDAVIVTTNAPSLEGSLRVGDAAPHFFRARVRN